MEGHRAGRARGGLWAAVAVHQQLVVRYARDLQEVQAPAHEEVLAVGLPRQLALATLEALVESLHCTAGEHLQCPEEAKAEFAVGEVDSGTCCLHMFEQPASEPRREEDGVRVHLHRPLSLLVQAFLFHLLPSLQEDLRVQDVLLDPRLRLEAYPQDAAVDAHRRPGRQPGLDVAVDAPGLAREDARAFGQLRPDQGQLHGFGVGAHDAKAEERREVCGRRRSARRR
mmetsp:Transcript_118015/g.328911  ORF Transcript_118015/g.328911 Transcript_118015/m.328911 type:complete len:227 (+) Transcript_118015:345-1025(+)